MPVISTNTAANTAVRYLNANSESQSDSLAKLASGSRITRASDDAAGLAISTKISSDVTALEQASTNASHGISILQTADGGAANVSDILERMKTLASQSASGTVTDTERAYIQAEFEELQDEIDAISTSTRYNGQSLLDGTSDFADDTVETAATATGALSDVTASDASLSGTTALADLSLAAGETASFTLTIDGTETTVTLGDDTSVSAQTITAAQIVSAINTATGATNASLDTDGNLVLTDTGALEISVSDFSASGASSFDASSLGLTETSAVGSTEGSVTIAAGETASFKIGTVEVTLGDADSTSTQTLSAQDVADAINSALADANDYSATASVDDDGNLTISTREEGSDASLTLSDFTGIDASDLGLTETSTGVVAATGTTTESASTGADVVVGSDYTDTITLTLTTLTTESLGIKELDVSTQEGAAEALAVLDMAIDDVSKARAEMGATMSRFEFRSTQLETSIENLEAAESAIADVDIATEQAKLSAASVKVQAAVAAASQANEMPENLLKLLQ
ncbi:flagellin N-terminal helical domain-containing protein [Roseibium suaedae]|uniref:Flagellin n=1 Tax=Roseibium suaedae TaxID=735517 RepID=A0A1M7IAA1_9HYPH|nr:flagellin [Roseibium suaedae]